MFVFSNTFSVLWEFTFSMFWELYGFLLPQMYLRNLKFEMFVFSHIFSRAMEIHFSHVLGTVWISASPEKPCNFGMFVFSHTLAVLWGFTFPTFCELYGLMPHMKELCSKPIAL